MNLKEITLFLNSLLAIFALPTSLLSMQLVKASYSAEDIALLQSVGLTKYSNGAEVTLTAKEINVLTLAPNALPAEIAYPYHLLRPHSTRACARRIE